MGPDRLSREAFAAASPLIGPDERRILALSSRSFATLVSSCRPLSKVCFFAGKDDSPKNAGEASSCENLFPVKGDPCNLPFPDNAFDAVLCSGAWTNGGGISPDYKGAINEMARVARPGGKVFMTLPNRRNLPYAAYRGLMGYSSGRPLMHAELEGLFLGAGLRAVQSGGYHPAHGLLRFKKSGFGMALHLLGKLAGRAQGALDRLTEGRYSSNFGFEIFTAGVKA